MLPKFSRQKLTNRGHSMMLNLNILAGLEVICKNVFGCNERAGKMFDEKTRRLKISCADNM
jgi:hypothetical protein